jgi:hypothetical protein
MKYVLAALIVLLAAFSLLSLDGGDQQNDTPVTGLPWQIERLPGGATQVFDITLGRTTLEEAIARLGDGAELAIIAAPGATGTLETYYRHYAAGPITGSLILVLDVDDATLVAMRERAQRDAGTRRYLLHPDDMPAAYRAAVKIVTFLPTLNLDTGIAKSRFGEPGEVIEAGAEQRHWLYPDLGLDVVLNAQGKDLLQYLTSGEFSAHRERLRQGMTATR